MLIEPYAPAAARPPQLTLCPAAATADETLALFAPWTPYVPVVQQPPQQVFRPVHSLRAAALLQQQQLLMKMDLSAAAAAAAQTPIEMKVNWATSPSNTPKQDTSKHHHIFVGDLSPEIETAQLREAFAPFGDISDCRVVRDPQTLKSKGYGFVSFVKKNEAENAISAMNGQWLGSRAIRTNWATRKPPANRSQNESSGQKLEFSDVFLQSSDTNSTVYCGGISQGLTEELMHKTFGSYGLIDEVRVFKDKGYAFIRFKTKVSATQAIVGVHNTEVMGQRVKCSWGKEAGDPNNQPPQPVSTEDNHETFQNIAQYAYPYQQMGYWYPQGYPQMQAGQFMQGMQYPYGQFYGQGFGPVRRRDDQPKQAASPYVRGDSKTNR